MLKVHREIVVNANPEKCFDFIADPSLAPLFVSGLHAITPIGVEPRGKGNTWAWEYDMAGVPLRGNAECIEFERPGKYVWRSTTGVMSTWTYMFEATEGGTKISVDIEYEIPDSAVAGKITDSAVAARINEQQADNGIQNLKVVLEEMSV